MVTKQVILNRSELNQIFVSLSCYIVQMRQVGFPSDSLSKCVELMRRFNELCKEVDYE